MSTKSVTSSSQNIYVATLGPGRITCKGASFFPLENDYRFYKIAFKNKYQNPDCLERCARIKISNYKSRILNPIKIYEWIITLLKQEYISIGGEVLFNQLFIMKDLQEDLVESITKNSKEKIFENYLEAVCIINLISSHSERIKGDEIIVEFCRSVKNIEILKNIERQKKIIADLQRVE